ncbi:MAG TPA: GvpL/GvpF family gas vesicle protein [Candidatus Limnocylindrales bacterium]|nr:GvpL/GvpF family gas vesicle protein [Candidatus Limnocylindrales bacterium]
MSRVLAYCAYLERHGLTPAESGVEKSSVHILESERLRLLWSEIPWPFQPEHLQQNAVEFHEVVHRLFRQVAVVPFRLLSTFEDRQLLERFVAEHRSALVADLERLEPFVQMEAVVYTVAEKSVAAASGKEYLQAKAQQANAVREHAQMLRDRVAEISADVHLRENKNGIRLFALVRRGAEQKFKETITQLEIPKGLSRRVSGPWPTAEFMSGEVKMPALVTRNE